VFSIQYRYAPGASPPLPYEVEWFPTRFRWTEHDGALGLLPGARPARDVGRSLLHDAPAPPRLEDREGNWYLYAIPAGGGHGGSARR